MTSFLLKFKCDCPNVLLLTWVLSWCDMCTDLIVIWLFIYLLSSILCSFYFIFIFETIIPSLSLLQYCSVCLLPQSQLHLLWFCSRDGALEQNHKRRNLVRFSSSININILHNSNIWRYPTKNILRLKMVSKVKGRQWWVDG